MRSQPSATQFPIQISFFVQKCKKGEIRRNGFSPMIYEKHNYFKIRTKKDTCQLSVISHKRVWLSSAREFHPHALQEPYVTVSCHTAPTVQPRAGGQIPMIQTIWVH